MLGSGPALSTSERFSLRHGTEYIQFLPHLGSPPPPPCGIICTPPFYIPTATELMNRITGEAIDELVCSVIGPGVCFLGSLIERPVRICGVKNKLFIFRFIFFLRERTAIICKFRYYGKEQTRVFFSPMHAAPSSHT